MKKISIIVPVYNVEKYLEKCLNSLVNQTLKEIEIVIVNDGSTDNSQSIIEKYKNKYPDIIKAYSTKNGGAAKARNYALQYVTGEYIGFVDSDDYISEEMYEKLYNKAIEKNADIVCCNYYRVKCEKDYIKKQFGNKNINKDDVFDKNIYESKLLFDEVPYLWNKIFKTEIVKKNNLKFQNDLRIYEDLIFTYQAFSHANKISRVDDALYFYIVAREGALTQTLTEKRFDIFKMYQKLVDYYKEIGKYDEVSEALVYVLLKHIYVILEKQTLKQEKKLKKKYLKTAFEYLEKNVPNWKENKYFELQNKNKKSYTSKFYWKCCILIGYNIAFINKRIKSILPKAFKFIIFGKPGNTYSKNCKKRIKEKQIFIFPQQGNNLSGNMFYIVKELVNNSNYNNFTIYIGYSDDCKKKFENLLKNYNLLCKNVKLIKNKTNRFAKVLARSKYLFTDTSFPVYFIKRNEQVCLNTWHGTPLKTLGKSTENDFFDIANVQKNFVISDYLLYPSEFMKNIMIEDYMLNGIANNKILLCGYPRNEIFLRDDVKSEKEKRNLSDKTLIAYMPTWRGNVREFDIEQQLNIAQNHIKAISAGLKENQILYVNMHPFIGNKLDLSNYSNVKAFPKDVETYDFLSICDILITDYSSVFFDYSITHKKIILFAYDEEDYFKNRGVYIKFKELPFPKVETTQELIKEINEPINYDDTQFIETYCKYENKDISKLICEKVILNKENEIKTECMPKSDKENILLYADNFKPNMVTKDFIRVVNNTNTDMQYNYYVSYITRKLSPNKNAFKKIVNKIKFYGQLGSNTNSNLTGMILIKLLNSKKKLYNKFESKYNKLYQLELRRIYQDINFKTLIFYGEIDSKKLYELSNMNCRKILYINKKEEFNKQVNKKIYNKLDYILTTSEDSYNIIKDYCGKNENIKIISPINNLNDLNKFI